MRFHQITPVALSALLVICAGAARGEAGAKKPSWVDQMVCAFPPDFWPAGAEERDAYIKRDERIDEFLKRYKGDRPVLKVKFVKFVDMITLFATFSTEEVLTSQDGKKYKVVVQAELSSTAGPILQPSVNEAAKVLWSEVLKPGQAYEITGTVRVVRADFEYQGPVRVHPILRDLEILKAGEVPKTATTRDATARDTSKQH